MRGGYMKNFFIVYFVLLCCIILSGCSGKDGSSGANGSPGVSCRGIYYTRDANNNLLKFNEYYNISANACYTDPLPLEQWEITDENWKKKNVSCTPQPQFASRTLVAANNFYTYRDGKIYLDFDSTTGIYRKITIAEGKNGLPSFSRLQGCFYQRTGIGVDAVHGKQILLDTEINKIKTSENFEPMEIFKYTETATSMEMTRFDDSSTWDFKFCPELNTPWGFCDKLRNGNIMYYPILSLAEQNEMLNEAMLIRRQFNYNIVAKSVFENLWNTAKNTHHESGRNNWKYMISGVVDTPRYIDQAWREYVMGSRPYMPDIISGSMPPICYDGMKNVILADGSTARIYGEICYENSAYTFIGH
jgi:hypothetical protein